MRKKEIICVLAAISCGAAFCSCGKPIESADPNDFSAVFTEMSAEDSAAETTTTVPYQNNAAKTEDDGTLILNVPHQSQAVSYLTACETLATVSLLQYYGIEISPEDFIERYLPVTDYPHLEAYDNQLHGESPWNYFLGDPMAPDAYGCYNTVIAKALNSITDGLAMQLDNEPLDKLCSTFIDKGHPVIIWATMNMEETHDGNSWILPNGEWYTFTCPEHALLLIGYDSENYYFSDSLKDEDVTAYSRESVETAYAAMYSMALSINWDASILEKTEESIRSYQPAVQTEESPDPAVEDPAVSAIEVPEESMQVPAETELNAVEPEQPETTTVIASEPAA